MLKNNTSGKKWQILHVGITNETLAPPSAVVVDVYLLLNIIKGFFYCLALRDINYFIYSDTCSRVLTRANSKSNRTPLTSSIPQVTQDYIPARLVQVVIIFLKTWRNSVTLDQDFWATRQRTTWFLAIDELVCPETGWACPLKTECCIINITSL